MNRVANLVDFCKRTGILVSSPSTNTVTFGPYGQLLLRQIKTEWLRVHLDKFEQNHLIASPPISLFQTADNQFDMNFYVSNFMKLPVGLLNIHNNKKSQHPLEHFNEPKEFNFLTKQFKDDTKNQVTHLNAFHFFSNRQFNKYSMETSSDINSICDPLSFWQRERKNWWVKISNCPEYVMLKHMGNQSDPISNVNICYELVKDLNKIDKEPGELNYLENIKHLTNLTEASPSLRSILGCIDPSNVLSKETSQMIITQTTCEAVLENILLDSVQFRRNKADILKNVKPEVPKTVFRLDFKLAPFKACILYKCDPADSNENFVRLANDLKKMFAYNQISVFLTEVRDESHLQNEYDRLDEMGVPYSIYLPTSIAKDGISFVRNRETTLCEHLHFSNIVKQFCAISRALDF